VAGGFKLNSRILGPKGMHLMHLIRESGAEKIELGLPPAEASGGGGGGGGSGGGGGGGSGPGGGNHWQPTSAEGGAALHIVAGSEQALQRAKGLAAADKGGVSDPYAKLSVKAGQKELAGKKEHKTAEDAKINEEAEKAFKAMMDELR